jgi:hypothetical protein
MSFNEYSFLVSIPGNWIAAGFFLIVASFLRRLARDQQENWQKATSLTERSFEHSDPAILVAQRGCVGLIGAWIYNSVALICFLFAIDQVLWNGTALILSNEVILEWMVELFEELRRN